jgi:hypothetical protein
LFTLLQIHIAIAQRKVWILIGKLEKSIRKMAANEGNQRFNAEAAAWDSNPDVQQASAGALKALLSAFPDLERRRNDGSAATEGKHLGAFLAQFCKFSALNLERLIYELQTSDLMYLRDFCAVICIFTLLSSRILIRL